MNWNPTTSARRSPEGAQCDSPGPAMNKGESAIDTKLDRAELAVASAVMNFDEAVFKR